MEEGEVEDAMERYLSMFKLEDHEDALLSSLSRGMA